MRQFLHNTCHKYDPKVRLFKARLTLGLKAVVASSCRCTDQALRSAEKSSHTLTGLFSMALACQDGILFILQCIIHAHFLLCMKVRQCMAMQLLARCPLPCAMLTDQSTTLHDLSEAFRWKVFSQGQHHAASSRCDLQPL